MPTISLITYCRGRAAQAAQFVPAALAALGEHDELVLVLYGETVDTGAVVPAITERRVTLVTVENAQWFHMDHARNVGGRAARGEILIFADIDFALSMPLIEEARILKPRQFFVQPDKLRSFGFLVVNRADYYRCQGYEEAICGYGHDDIGFRTTLGNAGCGLTVMKRELAPITLGNHCRILQTHKLGDNAQANLQILRALRRLDPVRNNLGRNWGWGARTLQQSAMPPPDPNQIFTEANPCSPCVPTAPYSAAYANSSRLCRQIAQSLKLAAIAAKRLANSLHAPSPWSALTRGATTPTATTASPTESPTSPKPKPSSTAPFSHFMAALPNSRCPASPPPFCSEPPSSTPSTSTAATKKLQSPQTSPSGFPTSSPEESSHATITATQPSPELHAPLTAPSPLAE